MKTLFLDFDGPLFPDRYIRFHNGQNKPYPGRVAMHENVSYWVMDPLAVELLNFLHDLHPFQTVVSSSWKKFIDKEQCQDLFFENGLKLHFANDWKTPTFKGRFNRSECNRAPEILAYLRDNQVSDYLILDDPWSGSSLKEQASEFDENKVVLVNPDVGISSHDYLKMTKIVRQWAGLPEQKSLQLW